MEASYRPQIFSAATSNQSPNGPRVPQCSDLHLEQQPTALHRARLYSTQARSDYPSPWPRPCVARSNHRSLSTDPAQAIPFPKCARYSPSSDTLQGRKLTSVIAYLLLSCTNTLQLLHRSANVSYRKMLSNPAPVTKSTIRSPASICARAHSSPS